MPIIGTAGHVDHGKSTLVRALTAIDPDRLMEEKARGLTIDLGFAWFPLGEEMIGVVDVPGHEDFIENMLAGAGSIDAALLVVAADEGVMPQTREHLTILDLLGIRAGVVALTKVDVVEDPDWLGLVEDDLRETLAGTVLWGAEIVRVSGATGAGLDALRDALGRALRDAPQRVDWGRPVLPVDRVFSVKGVGTVVTGTLSGGVLRGDDNVELLPNGVRGRVRGIQSYEETIEAGLPGSRVAVNVAGVARGEVQRGDVLTVPGVARGTTLLDVSIRQVAGAARTLRHNDEMKLFIGAAVVMARVRLLEGDEIRQGEQGLAQLQTREPVVVLPGGRFILRVPSPAETVGGGVVLDANPGRRHKRRNPHVVARLRALRDGDRAARVVVAAQGRELVPAEQVIRLAVVEPDMFWSVVNELLEAGRLLKDGTGRLLAWSSAERVMERVREEVSAYHAMYPLRAGMPIAEAAGAVHIGREMVAWLAELDKWIEVDERGRLRLDEHEVVFTAAQVADAARLLEVLEAKPFAPPSLAEAVDMVGGEVLAVLIERGEVVKVSDDVILGAGAYATLGAVVGAMLDAGEAVTVPAVRDRIGSSRKYVLAYLEHLDALGVTRRVGDVRVRR